MYRLVRKIIVYFICIFYTGVIFLMPFQWYYIGKYAEIFPALDLAVIYYISVYCHVKNLHLFLLGILLDVLYHMQIGSNSLILIIANLLLVKYKSRCSLQAYYTNIYSFPLYSLFTITARFILVAVNSTHYVQNISIFFYYCTTIFVYPIIHTLLEKPINVINGHTK